MHAIETIGLSHTFSNEVALRDVHLAVPSASIYGFLGPNGAGKTTTLRLVLGLLRRQHGTIEVFGRSLDRHRLEILRRVGSSIESPSVYGQLTARENLEVWRRVFRCPSRRIAQVLELVGLASTGSKRADQFSLGMKQRLSIAVALLHEPTLLILDEPTNGLDPHGILEMRALLSTLNTEHGVTVLVSSHILSEIERIVTHVGVIHRGTMKFQGTLAALLSRQETSAFTRIETSDNAAALEIARRGGTDRTGRWRSGDTSRAGPRGSGPSHRRPGGERRRAVRDHHRSAGSRERLPRSDRWRDRPTMHGVHVITGFIHSVSSEWLKQKRSLTLWLVLGSAAFIPTIIFLSRFRRIGGLAAIYQAPRFWEGLFRQSWEAMALMILPMAIMLIASLIAQLEDRNNAWKQLHASPQPLATIFLAKLTVILGLVAGLIAAFTAAIYLSGVLPAAMLRTVDAPGGAFPLAYFLKRGFSFFVDVLPIVALQYLLAVRFRSFLVPLGIGMALWIFSIGTMSWAYNYIVPYSYAGIDYLMIEYQRKLVLPVSPRILAGAYFLVFTVAGYVAYVSKRDRG